MNNLKVQASLIAVVAILISTIVMYLGSSSINQVQQVRSQWASYTKNSGNISYTLQKLQNNIGYGGFIHQFKNMILRQDLNQYESIQVQLDAAIFDIEAFQRYPISQGEQIALTRLKEVMLNYQVALIKARKLITEGASPTEVDGKVRVNDEIALEALQHLSNISISRSRQKEAELSAEIESSVNRLYMAGFILPVILIAAYLLIIYIYRLASANEKRKESIHFFDQLFEATPDSILTVGEDGRINRSNSELSHLTGYDRSELKKMTVEDLIPARHRHHHKERRNGYFRAPNFRAMNNSPSLAIAHKDGREIPVEISLNYLRHGAQTTAIAVIRDISARQASEEKIRISEAQLRSAQKIARIGSWTLDMTTQQMKWSDEVYSILELDPGHKPSIDLYFSGSSSPLDFNKLSEAGQRHYRQDREIRLADGSVRYLREQGEMEFSEQSVLVRVIGTVQDITEEKRISHTLKQAAAVFENISDAVIIADSNRQIIATNRAFTNITGYTQKESLGQNPGFIKSGRHDQAFYKRMNDSLEKYGQWHGEIWDKRKNGEIYPSRTNIKQVKNGDGEHYYIGVSSDISTQKQTEDKLLYQASHDYLTDLPNRLSLIRQLGKSIQHAKLKGEMVSILYIDLDNFKAINDSLGHPVGDEMLKVVAKRLREAVSETVFVARLGGDEFMIVLDGHNSKEPAEIAAINIQEALSHAVTVGRNELYISPSIGISTYPEDGQDVTSLVKNADFAMFRAKEKGRNSYEFYSQKLADKALQRLTIEQDLRQAISDCQFVLHYQPQFDLKSGRINGAEALVRWIHPEKGLISPADFIPIAEETNLIIPLGEWVIRTACEQMMLWKREGVSLPQLSINLAGPQIIQGKICQVMREVLSETGLNPKQIELEVTETFIVEHQAEGIPVLEQLRELGVQLSIDDFGTGYSSLNQLKQLPIDKLKIDRSFVWGIPDDSDDVAITKSIIDLAQNMSLEIIAEGIETEQQKLFLQQLKCESGQGFLFSKPLNTEAFKALYLSQYHPFTGCEEGSEQQNLQ